MRKIFTLFASLALAIGVSAEAAESKIWTFNDWATTDKMKESKTQDGLTLVGKSTSNSQWQIQARSRSFKDDVFGEQSFNNAFRTNKTSAVDYNLITFDITGPCTIYAVAEAAGSGNRSVVISTGKYDNTKAQLTANGTLKSFSYQYEGTEATTAVIGGIESIYIYAVAVVYSETNPAWSAESFTAIIGGENTFPVIKDAADNTFTYASSDEAVATIAADGSISLVGAGSTIISATYKNAENADVTISYTLEVLAAGATKDAAISFSANSYSGNFAGETSALPSFVNPNNISGVTFTSSNPSFAAVDNNGKVTINTVNVNNKNYWAADGEATITAAFAGDNVYSEASVSYTIKINPMTVVDDFTEIALDNVTMATLPTAIDVPAGDVLAITANFALTQKEDAPTILGKSFANYIQIRATNAPSASNPKGTAHMSNNVPASATLTLAPTADMTVYLYGRRQSNTKNTANGIIRQFNVNDGKSIKVCDAGETSDFAAIPQKIAFSHWANDVLKEYAYNVVAVELEAGKTYTVWAAGTTYQLYGVGYELAPLAAPVHGHGVDGTETEIELPSNTEIKLSHDDADANIMWRWVGETANDPAGDAPEVVALAEETAPADGEWKNYNDVKPVFNHDKDMTLEFYAEKNGVKSETKNLLVKLAETVGIADINVDNANAPVEYFNLQGIRVDNPSNGIFIRRQGNEVSKVIIK